ncbi:hypothetical protein FRUB_02598 [Fimbriiglobus ruber]|uniref:Uncharacterized protein n=1 Tax=Fimbriiglobus ruber TaxID=1908690 RepID=A0A225E0H5_9BACT|nr:hypothetical protein FRUB_02598 [Fimbriiglobus ruber]
MPGLGIVFGVNPGWAPGRDCEQFGQTISAKFEVVYPHREHFFISCGICGICGIAGGCGIAGRCIWGIAGG